MAKVSVIEHGLSKIKSIEVIKLQKVRFSGRFSTGSRRYSVRKINYLIKQIGRLQL